MERQISRFQPVGQANGDDDDGVDASPEMSRFFQRKNRSRRERVFPPEFAEQEASNSYREGGAPMYTRDSFVFILLLTLAACDNHGTEPTAPANFPGMSDISVKGAVQRASGGANWTVPASLFGFEVANVLAFNATKRADDSVTGRIEYHQSFLGFDIRLNARMTCMEIYDGNRVKYGGVVEVSNDPDIVPGEVFIWFQGIDNGEGQQPDLSTIAGAGDEGANEAFCASSNPPNFAFPISGNIQVSG